MRPIADSPCCGLCCWRIPNAQREESTPGFGGAIHTLALAHGLLLLLLLLGLLLLLLLLGLLLLLLLLLGLLLFLLLGQKLLLLLGQKGKGH
jgi:hypothetical protein